MLTLALGLLLTFVPADRSGDLEACIARPPFQPSPPVTWAKGIDEMWTDPPPVTRDSIRSYLSQVRKTRNCLLALEPSKGAQPYLDNVVRTFDVEAALLAALRRFPQAHSTFARARSFLDSTSVPSTEDQRTSWPPTLHQNQGFLYYLLGNLSASIEHYTKAYETTPQTSFDRRVQFLIDVAILRQRTQDYESALFFLEQAERLFLESPLSTKTHSFQRARMLSVQADLLLEQTLNTEFDVQTLLRVRDLARQSLRLSESGTERHARTSLILSESLGYLGRYEEAYRLNEDVRQYARSSNDARLQTLVPLKLGVLHAQTERWQEADTVFQRAHARAETLDDLDYQRRILRALGRLHEMQQNWAEAEHFYREGVSVIEQYREALTASEWSMTAFAEWRDVHRGLVRTLLAQDRPREALTALDRSRARHLRDLLTQARVANELPSEKRVRFDSLSRGLTDVRNRLGEASLSDEEQTALRNREAELMAARRQLLQLDSTTDRPSIDAIAETLAEQDRALVSYFVDDPWPVYDRPPRSAAFVLTGDTLRTVPLPGLTQDSVQARVEATSPLFTSRGKPNRANAMHFDLEPLHALYDDVYAPVVEHLPDDRPLTVVPDGPLFHIPFSMLVASMPDGRFAHREARYVLHERPTALELASSLVVTDSLPSFDRSTFDPELAAYGVSEFDTLRSVPSALRTALPEAIRDSSLALPSLPGVREELQAVESAISGARTVLNDEATEASFCRAARTAGVLHVASHAVVNASSPLRNALLLRSDRAGPSSPTGTPPDSAASSSNGVLFLHELQGLRSRVPMVVLSGCNTASGTLRSGEGMESLQYAFRAMGAQSTVSTLWPVADGASVDLMDGFYDHLAAGRPKDVALRQAQLDYLDAHPTRASPFFWAPPVLYGSPLALPLDGPLVPGWAWWALALVGLLLLGVAIWWYTARPTALPRPPFA